MLKDEYDVIVLGSGFAGSIAAVCLGSAGISTLVVEKKEHPRFVIGESSTPQTTSDIKYLANTWNVPELRNVSHYAGVKSIGCITYPKEVFWFGYHEEGKKLAPDHEVVSMTTLPPLGPDSHMLREDIDTYLVSLFPKYKVDFIENTAPQEYTTHKDYVEIGLVTYNKDGAEKATENRTVRGKFIVDATGHNCFLARKFGIFNHDPTLKTRSRTIYSHFQTTPDWKLDRVLGGRCEHINTSRDNGTMHHVFPGGWIWVIPFENNTVSLGITLDLELYPLDHSISAQEEWDSILNRFPTIKEHLGGLVRLRSFIRSGRIQITSDTIIGDRFVLTPHASTFIDPLYSTGMALSVRFVKRLVPVVQQIKSEDADTERIKELLAPMQELFDTEVDCIDKIVYGTYYAYHHLAVYRQYWRFWIIATLQTVGLTRDTPEALFGGFNPYFRTLLDEAYTLVEAWGKNVRKTKVMQGRAPLFTVDEGEAIALAEKLKVLADQALDEFHKKVLFDIMPTWPAVPIPSVPLVSPGGAASEYVMDFLLGARRPRWLSLPFALYEMASARISAKLWKLFGITKHGKHYAHLFDGHYSGKKSVKPNPKEIFRRLYYRIRGQQMPTTK